MYPLAIKVQNAVKMILAVEMKSEKFEEHQQQLTVQLNNDDLLHLDLMRRRKRVNSKRQSVEGYEK